MTKHRWEPDEDIDEMTKDLDLWGWVCVVVLAVIVAVLLAVVIFVPKAVG